jgi:hypothetical protein
MKFNFINHKEFKIFLTFFLIYFLFVHWIGWYEESVFALTRAIVDEGRFEIDSYANQTGDRAYYQGHYYTDKAPGTSFLAIPTYVTWKFLYFNFFPESFRKENHGTFEYITYKAHNTFIVILPNPSFFILTSMILITIFTSSLFSAFLVVLIYKISKYFTKKESTRVFLTFTAGLGTLIFPYALVLMNHATSTFFAFLAFYLLFKVKQERIQSNKHFIVSGLSIGYAITTSLPASIIGIACLAYLLHFRRSGVIYFITGLFLGISPFIFYNYIITNSFFTPPRAYLDKEIFSRLWRLCIPLFLPNLFIIVRLLIYPHKGLLFYYPIFLFSFLGMYYMYKKFKAETLLILFIFFSYLIINTKLLWWGGTCFGPRHLTPTVPFLILPLVYVAKKANQKAIFKYLLLLLAVFSILTNFTGLQPLIDSTYPKNFSSFNSYLNYMKKEVNTFKIIANPLYDYYFPNFLKCGPRSRILEDLLNWKIPYIRDMAYHQVETSESYLYIPFLPFLVVALIILAIWRKEILTKIKKIRIRR